MLAVIIFTCIGCCCCCCDDILPVLVAAAAVMIFYLYWLLLQMAYLWWGGFDVIPVAVAIALIILLIILALLFLLCFCCWFAMYAKHWIDKVHFNLTDKIHFTLNVIFSLLYGHTGILQDHQEEDHCGSELITFMVTVPVSVSHCWKLWGLLKDRCAWRPAVYMARKKKNFNFSINDGDFSALTLLVGRQEGHLACENGVVGCWRGCLSGARCRLASGPADATATHCLLLQ